MRSLLSVLRRYGDVVLAAGFAALMTLDLLLRPDGRQWLALLFGLLATVPLAARRRMPLASFLLVLAGLIGVGVTVPGAYETSAPFLAVSFFALFSLGAHAVGAQFWMSVAAVGLSIVLAAASEGSGFSPGAVMFFLAFAGTPWASGVGLRLYRERQAAEGARTARLLAEEAARNAETLEAERSRVARDLHDVVSHAVAVTLIQARGGRRLLISDPNAARGAFDTIERINAQALGDMRRLLNVLKSSDDVSLAPMPSLRRLPELVDEVRASGVQVDIEVIGDLDQVPPGVDLSAYRVIQEALTNIMKHAGPARAKIGVRCSADDLQLVVSDDGSGVTAAEPGGHGLTGIRERVAVLGGDMQAGPGQVCGFVVRARLPYQVRS